jgi:glycosyltransferase involved in cell wall biosynthesis
MKLALITHNFFRGDGQSRVNYEIAHHALRQGAEVWLLADQVDASLLEQGAHWVKVHPQQQKLHLRKVPEFAHRASAALRTLPVRPDIIHANGYTLDTPHHINTSHFVHASWRRSPVHTARLRRDLYGAYQWTYSAMNARWERKAYTEARLVAAVSERVRQELIAAGVPSEKVCVVVNGVDLAEFAPGPEDRASLGLPSGVPLALFVGDIRTPRKNLDTILAALKTLPGLHLAVVGAVAASPYPALAERLGVAARTHFLDFRRDVSRLMRAADLFVFPSRYEACSLALLEAMASGMPIVTAETTGGAELVTRDCGIVLPSPDDTEALSAALRSLMESPSYRAAMGKAAREVAEQHSWEQMATEYMALYARQMQ